MNEFGEGNWPHNLPYGPLTRRHFDMLGGSFHDASLTDVHWVAEERGITSGDYLQLVFAEHVELKRPEGQAGSDKPVNRQPAREPGESQEDWETRTRFAR